MPATRDPHKTRPSVYHKAHSISVVLSEARYLAHICVCRDVTRVLHVSTHVLHRQTDKSFILLLMLK